MKPRPNAPGPWPYPGLPTSPRQAGETVRRWTGLARNDRVRNAAGRSADSLFLLLAIFTYFFVRGLMSSSYEHAVEHARALLRLERALGIAWESDLQDWAGGVPGLIPVMNSVYIYGHWPVIALTLIWLLRSHRQEFRLVRTTMVISGMIGFAFFALYPMAPPRLMPDLAFVDTIMRDTSSYRVLQPPMFTNPYAAMPSLHVGWNLIMGLMIYRNTRHIGWRVFAVLMPLMMWIATVLTANHYVLDGVAGSLVALTGLAIATWISHLRRTDRVPHSLPGESSIATAA